jgi:hypothetical protein
MAKLPDVTAYGARPSLRSNRVDKPDESGLILADGLVRAAENVKATFDKVKEKNDRLNYSLAKNELLRADIAAREGLNDREDYENFNESYAEAYRQAEEKIYEKYRISGSDRELLGSESEMIVARGGVYASELARGKRLDFQKGEVEANLDDALMQIQEAPPDLANELMLSQLESINAAVAEGIYSDYEGQKRLEKFVSDAATQSLEGMDVEFRIAELEKSLAKRNQDGPIDREAIARGEGSGSIADFLPRSQVQKMLKIAKNANELENELGQAQAILDQVEAQVGTDDPTAIVDGVRKATKGADPKVRARAEEMARTRRNELQNAEAAAHTDNYERLAGLLAQKVEGEDGQERWAYEWDSLPTEQLVSLPPQMQVNLEAWYRKIRTGDPFGKYDNMTGAEYAETEGGGQILTKPSYKAWVDMTPAEKAAVNLESPEWQMAFTPARWESMIEEQESIRNPTTSGKPKSYRTVDQIVSEVWTGDMKMPRTKRTEEQDQMYYEMRGRVADEIARVSVAEYGGKEVPDAREREIAQQIMGQLVWRRDKPGIGWLFGRDSKEPVEDVDADKSRYYFVPIDRWRNKPFPLAIGPEGSQREITWDQFFVNRASAIHQGYVPNQRDKENAYAQYILFQMGLLDQGEAMQRIDEALAGEYEY